MRLAFLLIFFILLSVDTYGQSSCPSCTFTNTFNGITPKNPQSPQIIEVNSNDWDKALSTNDVVRFEYKLNKEYEWLARNKPGTVSIAGIVLEKDVKLTIGRHSNDEDPGFDIEGKCILVKAGATLNFAYYTKLKNVTICVEAGGVLNFDSQSSGNSGKSRDDFDFGDVKIILSPTSELNFGNADLIIPENGLQIEGWTGEKVCENGVPPSEGESGNITWTAETERICDLLNFRVLPVEWHELSAEFQVYSRSNSVNWSTLKEWENSHFEIERSIGGVNNYQKIGRVEGIGWADEITEYSFCDDDLPLKGGRVYYRIKQVDFDGTFDYSQTMMVNVPGMQVTKGEWRAYPNPIRGQEFQIARLASEDLKSDIQVKILTSQIPVASFKVRDEEELNAYLGKLLPRIPQGIFVVELQSNKQVEYLKVIKE